MDVFKGIIAPIWTRMDNGRTSVITSIIKDSELIKIFTGHDSLIFLCESVALSLVITPTWMFLKELSHLSGRAWTMAVQVSLHLLSKTLN